MITGGGGPRRAKNDKKIDFRKPVNIGSEEMVSINQLAEMAIKISKKKLNIKNILGDEFKSKYGFN